MDQQFVTRIVEAALLAANQPLTLAQLHGLFPLDEPAPEGSIERAIEELREQSSSRGIELVEVASGFRFQVKTSVHPWVARIWTERQTKYTRATLETLAIIAYRQPITGPEIQDLRGKSPAGVLRSLLERRLIRIAGRKEVVGRPFLYATTRDFLMHFGLRALAELPPLEEFEEAFGAGEEAGATRPESAVAPPPESPLARFEGEPEEPADAADDPGAHVDPMVATEAPVERTTPAAPEGAAEPEPAVERLAGEEEPEP